MCGETLVGKSGTTGYLELKLTETEQRSPGAEDLFSSKER